MPFKPGQKRHPNAGMKKGQVTKKSQAVQDIIEKALGKTLPESLMDDLMELGPKDRAHIKKDLMDYIYPKRKAVDVTTNGESINRTHDLASLTDEQLHDEYRRLIGGKR